MQLIDARDLAAWMLDEIEKWRLGIFNATGPEQPLTLNATGPEQPLTLGHTLERVLNATGSSAEIEWVDGQVLREEGLEPWDDVPLWLDLPQHPELRGFMAVDVSRALAAGLSYRPLEETVRDILGTDGKHHRDRRRTAG